MDRLDGVSHVRKIEEHGRKPRNDENSLRNDTELHRICVVEQFKRVKKWDKIGPRNVGTFDAKQAFLSRLIDDSNRFYSNPNWNTSIEEEFY